MTKHRCISDGLRRLRDCYRIIRPSWIKSPSALNEDGAALVEFTIVMPVFFLLVFGIIEWGMIFYLQNNMVNAARVGARTSSVWGYTLASANGEACRNLAGAGQQFTITSTDLCPGQRDVQVQVSVGAAQASVFNYSYMFTGGTISSLAKMRRELACPAVSAGVATCVCNTTVSPPTCS